MTTTPKTRTHILPPVAGRLEITSVRDYTDQIMEQLGQATIDLRDPKQHERLRQYLCLMLGSFVHSLQFDVAKGADRGISQVLTLARDPDYYELAKKRRQQARERTKQWASEHTTVPVPAPEPQIMSKGIELVQAEFGIYHVDTLEEPGFISLIGQANSLEEAKMFISRKFGPRSVGQQLRRNGADASGDRVDVVRMSDRQIVHTYGVG